MALCSNNKAFSLVEVVTASVIFSIAIVGIFASLANLKQQSSNVSDKSLRAALCAQQFLEDLRASVDMRDWDTGRLALTGAAAGGSCTDQNGVVYTRTYQIVAAGAYARKATVTVSWP